MGSSHHLVEVAYPPRPADPTDRQEQAVGSVPVLRQPSLLLARDPQATHRVVPARPQLFRSHEQGQFGLVAYHVARNAIDELTKVGPSLAQRQVKAAGEQ